MFTFRTFSFVALLFLFLFSFVVGAQILNGYNKFEVKPNMGDSPAGSCTPGPLYTQLDNTGANATSSQNFEASFDTFDDQVADDFVVPAGQTWTISHVDVEGVYFNGNGPATSVNVVFYPNTATLPGAPASCTIANAPIVSGAASGAFGIDLPATCTLAAGTYWVSVQANLDFGTGGQWGWSDRTMTSGSGAAFQNPGDGLSTGCTTWGRKTACITTSGDPDSIFQLVGTSNGVCATPTNTPTATATATGSPTCTPATAWQPAAPMPTPDLYGASATSDGTFYYQAGGFSFTTSSQVANFSRYNPATNTWTSLAPVPDLTNGLASLVYSPVNNKIYMFGGTDAAVTPASNATRIYNIATNTWSAGANMPDARGFMASGYFNNKIYLVGGYSTSNVDPAFANVWEYDPLTNTFNTSRTNMPQALGGAGSGVINGHLYVAGGRTIEFANLNTLYDYDIAANTWTTRADLPAGTNVPGSAVANGQLWLFGGGNPFSPETTSSTMSYYPAANTWTPGPPLAATRSFVSGSAVGNRIVAAGGYNGLTTVTTVEVLDAGCAPTPTPTITGTPTLTNTPTNTPTSTPTFTPTGTPTATPVGGAHAVRILPGCTANTLPANDDGSSPEFTLPFTANFFGTSVSSTFINNNGNITFGSSLGEFTPFPLSTTNRQIIAPFFADVDTGGSGSGLVQYGNAAVDGHNVFCANYINVGYFSSHTDKLNSFQVLLIDRSDTGAGNFDIELNYNQILWETGDASGGSGGLGGDSARAGYANGTTQAGTFFEIPGSAINGGLLDTNAATGLTRHSLNSSELGRYIFPVRGGVVCSSNPINFGETVTGNLNAASCSINGPTDLYTFTGAAGQQIAITLDARPAGGIHPSLQLIGPDGTTVVASGSGINNARIPSNNIFLSLPTSGQYTIRASSSGGLGDYGLSLYEEPVGGCTYSMSPLRTDVPPGGGSFNFDVITQTGCPPAQLPPASGVIYSNLGYQGWRVSFDVAPNAGGAAREETISIAGQTHTIHQFGTSAPTNDNFANAQMISGPNSVTPVAGYNTTASAEIGAGESTHAGNPPAKSVWYTWTAPADGLFSFSTSGSSFDTVMEIYACPSGTTCSLGNIVSVGANDDTTDFDVTSKVNFRATHNTEYRIAIDGKNGANGTLMLSWRQYSRLFRLYLQNFNGRQTFIVPETVVAGNGTNTVVPSVVSLGVYEFDLPADNSIYVVHISGPEGIVWNPNDFPLDTSFRYLDELMNGPAEGGNNTTSNPSFLEPHMITGYVENITAGELNSLSVINSTSRGGGHNFLDPEICGKSSTVIDSVPYAIYQCMSQPETYHDIVFTMQNKGFRDAMGRSVRSFEHYIDQDEITLANASFVASTTPTYGVNGHVLDGGAGTKVELTYMPLGNTVEITLRRTTDGSSFFEFPDLLPNTYSLEARKEGFVFLTPPAFTLDPPGRTIDIAVDSACAYSPSEIVPPPGSGGLGQFKITTNNSTCAWGAESQVPWLHIADPQTLGTGIMHFTADPNPGPARTGIIRAGGQDVEISQAEATNQLPVITGLTPPSVTMGDPDFDLTITGTNFIPGATVTFNGAPKTPVSLTSTQIVVHIASSEIAAAGTLPVVVINPAPGGGPSEVFGFIVNACSYTLSPPVQGSFDSSGGSSSFSVTTTSGCTWIPEASDYCMISFSTAGSSGSGVINFTVSANAGVARSANLLLGGQSVTVDQAAAPGLHRTKFDFDGDGRADVSVYRPLEGTWYLLNSSIGFVGRQFGITEDIPVAADYDGDGLTDLAVFRPSSGIWFLLPSATPEYYVPFGLTGDIPVPADYDGDGHADIAVYRPSTGTWYLNLPSGVQAVPFGLPTDKPVVGDYDGDDMADIAVYRPSEGIWYILPSSGGFSAIPFGVSTDVPVPADYDGDGKTDVAVYRPSDTFWYRLDSSNGNFEYLQFGSAGDKPVPGDYNGDTFADVAVYRPSTGFWYIWSCTGNVAITSTPFGISTDVPIEYPITP